MLVEAAPWQPAQAGLPDAGAFAQRSAPSWTQSIPGLAVSSRCIAWISGDISANPDSFCDAAISPATARRASVTASMTRPAKEWAAVFASRRRSDPGTAEAAGWVASPHSR